MKVIKRNSTGTGWLLYCQPEEVIEVATIDALAKALDTIEAWATAGFTCLGYVRYGEVVSGTQVVIPSPKTQPVATFGVFSEGTEYGLDSSQEDGFLGEGCHISFQDYAIQFAQVKSALAAGEAYQINLTYELSGNFLGRAPDDFRETIRSATNAACHVSRAQ